MTSEVARRIELGINIADQLDYSVELIVATQAMTGLIRPEFGGMEPSRFLASGNPFISHPAYNLMVGNIRPRTYRDYLMVSLATANEEINADIRTLGGIPVRLDQPGGHNRNVLFSRLVRFDLIQPGRLVWNVRGESADREYHTQPPAIDEIRKTFTTMLAAMNGLDPAKRPE